LHGKTPTASQDLYRSALVDGGWKDKDGKVRPISRAAVKSPQLKTTCKNCGKPVEQVKFAPRPRQYCDLACARAFRARRLKTLVSRANATTTCESACKKDPISG
jgi:hypothetical protein